MIARVALMMVGATGSIDMDIFLQNFSVVAGITYLWLQDREA